MNKHWSVYVIETDKYIQNNWEQKTVYIGMTKYNPEERFLQHQDGVKAYKSRYGKPLKLIKKYCVENITNKELANDIERLVWFKLLNSKKYRPVQKYAPSLQGRTDYLDDYPNYKG